MNDPSIREIEDYSKAIGTALQEVALAGSGVDVIAVLLALAERTGHVMALLTDDVEREHIFERVCEEIKRSMAVSSKALDDLLEQSERQTRKTN